MHFNDFCVFWVISGGFRIMGDGGRIPQEIAGIKLIRT